MKTVLVPACAYEDSASRSETRPYKEPSEVLLVRASFGREGSGNKRYYCGGAAHVNDRNGRWYFFYRERRARRVYRGGFACFGSSLAAGSSISCSSRSRRVFNSSRLP